MTDEKSAPQNIQDAFLNTVRREKIAVTIYLLSGAKLLGKIRSFDKFSVLLESSSQEQLIFKHAISTITVVRRVSGELRGQPAEVPHTEAQPQSDGSSEFSFCAGPVPVPPEFQIGQRRVGFREVRIE